ncbi:MAG TPA: GNAT family N-acetyltransferase [Phycisphaerae bacterium]|nr:GNAT family N-acetyltransferase [Phycisphaerae bacterium]
MTEPTRKEEVISVCMARPDLEGIADPPLPPPFVLRPFEPGDEQTWTDIWTRAEHYVPLTPETFAVEFGSDAEALAQRQLFLVDGGARAIGTATAWFGDEHHGGDCGRIHWVGIVPEMQGRGLSRPLLAATLRRMRALGCRSSFLQTHSVRTPAIRLYLSFGFVPEIHGARERQAWLDVRRRIAPSRLDKIDLAPPAGGTE